MARKPEDIDALASNAERRVPHFRIQGSTFVGPDVSNRGLDGANAGKAVKDVRRFSSTALKACDGDKANS